LLKTYANDGEYAVDIDNEPLKKAHYIPVGANIISDKVTFKTQKGDPIAKERTFIRHDPIKVAKQLMRIYFS
jgi:hypothetical protein